MSRSVAPATSMRLTLMGEADKEFAEPEVRRDSLMYTNPKVTIAVKDHLVIQVAASAIADYLGIRL